MKKISFVMLAGTAALLAACGESEGSASGGENSSDEVNNTAEENSADSGSDEAANEDDGTITISHELGDTEVPVNPEKVVVFDYGVLDVMENFGVDPAAVPQGNIPSYLNEFEGEEYENAGTLFEPDFETIYGMEPDLILIGGRTAEAYDELNDIAPTVMMSVDQTDYIASFEEQVTQLGEIFDRPDEAEASLKQVKEELDALQAVSDEDKNGLMVMTNEGQVSAYGADSRFGILHNEFGVTPADENIEDANHGQNVSFEYILETNPDMLFVLDRGAVVSDSGEEEDAASTLDNDLVNRTDAAENDNITYLNPEYWYLSAGGITSVQEMIKEVKEAVE
jgi:iron complex transport system substrate-binding protein